MRVQLLVLAKTPVPGKVKTRLCQAATDCSGDSLGLIRPSFGQQSSTSRQVCEISHERAREELGRVAIERHLGFDGLWSAA